MRTLSKIFGIVCLLILLATIDLSAQNATEIIKKSDDKMRGESNVTEMEMTIVRPRWERTIVFKSWSKSPDYSLTLITAPPKEKGQTFLKRKNDMWSWNPSINRMVKLPPSMLSQGWMGSDFTNDDLMNESSIVVDYNHKIVGSEKIDGHDCYKIKLTPKPDAPVVWGKQIKWITKDKYLQMKTEYYDEDNFLIKTEIGSDVKMMDGRKIPCRFELIPEEEPGHRTIVVMKSIKFNTDMKDSFFSQQNMKRIR